MTAPATIEQLKTESEIFTDAWAFMKKWYNVGGAEEEWAELMNEAKSIHKKHEDNKFCCEVMISVVCHIEKAWKDRN